MSGDETEARGTASAAELAAKLPDAGLRRLAEEAGGEAVSVLIELELPPQRVEAAAPPGESEPLRPSAVVAEAAGERRASEAVVERARAALRQLTGEDPVHLRAARAFAARLSGEQLAAVAGQPWARRIRPNRELRR